MTDEGMPNHGILFLIYFSGECKRLQGCKPDIKSRKSLLNLVLIREKELFDFEDTTERKERYGLFFLFIFFIFLFFYFFIFFSISPA
jgi:hypothetical protein